MNPALRFPMAAFSTMLVAIVAFGVARQDLTLLLAAALPAAASWIVTEGPRRRGLPRWLSTILVLANLAWTVSQAPMRLEPVSLAGTVGTFVLWTSVIKLYERKTTRDRRQLLGLSLVLMLSGCLATVHLIFAVLLVVYMVLIVTSLMLYRLERGAERYRDAAPGIPLPPPVFGGRAGRHLRRVVTSGLIVGAAISLLIFILFPRDVMQRFEGFGGRERASGFRTDVDLRSDARIAFSRREVMRVQWLDPGGTAGSAAEPLRLRGAVLDRYEPSAAKWVSSRDERASRTVLSGDADVFEPLGRPPVDMRQQTYTQIVELRLLLTDVLFSAWAPVAIAHSAGTLLFDGATLELRGPHWERGPRVRRYEVKVQPFVTPESLMALAGAAMPWTPPRFPVPGVEAEAERILEQVGEQRPDPEELERDAEFRWSWARQASGIFMRHLQSASFRYTTDLSDMVLRRGEDPIEAFLCRSRLGHCEFFASALCGMLQSVGVEARVVVGFVAVEYDGGEQRYIVRENNAHAWVEVRTGEWNWSTVDPTPTATLELLADAGRSWTDPLRWVYDGIDYLWRTRVVAFDAPTQTTLLRGSGERIAEWFRAGMTQLGDWMELLAERFEAGGIGRLWAISVVVTLVGGVATMVLLARRERRWRRMLRLDELPNAERRRLRRDAGFFADALLALERHGLAKPESRPPLMHADRLREAETGSGDAGGASGAGSAGDGAAPRGVERGVGDAFARLTELYYAIRFGGAVPSRSTQTEAAALLRRLDSALSRGGRAPRS